MTRAFHPATVLSHYTLDELRPSKPRWVDGRLVHTSVYVVVRDDYTVARRYLACRADAMASAEAFADGLNESEPGRWKVLVEMDDCAPGIAGYRR